MAPGGRHRGQESPAGRKAQRPGHCPGDPPGREVCHVEDCGVKLGSPLLRNQWPALKTIWSRDVSLADTEKLDQ